VATATALAQAGIGRKVLLVSADTTRARPKVALLRREDAIVMAIELVDGDIDRMPAL
jgi:hypothetical protein